MGSTSHNTYVPKDDPDSIDDIDIMGVVVPPPARAVGLKPWQHWVWQHEELDVVCYSLAKFVGLLLKSNPNVVGLLWLRPEHYLHRHPLFERLAASRDLFTSKRAYPAFVGYASAQLQNMAPREFRGYMGAKRKALVERYGYDTKSAAHAIRLLRMGTELLDTGALKVYRDADAEEIRAIKRGEWSLDEVKAEGERLFEAARLAHERSPLPDEPDAARAEELLVGITLDLWRANGEV